MMKKFASFLAVFLLAGVSAAFADEGKLVAAVGDIFSVRDGKEARLQRGAAVRAGDLIRVGVDSSAQIRMNDDSIVALAPNTQFKIEEYKFSADKPAEGRAIFSLLKGALRTVTGMIGREARENYAVKAGTVATIGIRGTHYRLRLCDEDCAADSPSAANGLYGGVTEGRIGVTNDSGTDDFGADEFFFVADAASRPLRLPGPPDLLIDRAKFLAKMKGDGASTVASAPTFDSASTLPAVPASAALNNLSNLTLQQLRPAELSASPSQLAHVAPIVDSGGGGFTNIGGSGTIRGQIVWMTNADIDLHMLAPTGGVVNFTNPTLSLGAATAQLDHDNLGSVIDIAPDKRVENITVTGTQIPTGLYTFSAHSYSGNNGGLPTTVQVITTGNGGVTSGGGTTTLTSGQTSGSYVVDYKPGVAPVYSTR